MTQAAGEVLQGFSRGLTMFFSTLPRRADTPFFRPGPGALPASKGAACGAGRALVLYSTGSFRVSVTSIRSPSRQISMVT